MQLPYRICFVCMGNICRSPIAEVVMRAKVTDAGLHGLVTVESAGTGDWHAGGPADQRTIDTLRAHGYDGESHIARQFKSSWFDEVDLVVAMDGKNLQSLRWLAVDGQRDKVVRLRSFDPASRGGDLDVPDPYYGGTDTFEEVLVMIEAACDGLLEHVRAMLA
ncbi:MAG TPA: low molecular weight protein-tyrosine-phosphatase [Mycobacteriales bacterium]|nr:low molecular weight protein-tyrosine-phosphatase [Mycobacteriales bacterium]